MVASVIGDEYHPEAALAALEATYDGAAMVGNGAVDICEGYCASDITHGDDRE